MQTGCQLSWPGFYVYERGADVDDKIRSLVEAPGGFTGQLFTVNTYTSKKNGLMEAALDVNHFLNTSEHNGAEERSPFYQPAPLAEGGGRDDPLIQKLL